MAEEIKIHPTDKVVEVIQADPVVEHKLTQDEIDELQKQADVRSNYDPTAEEKRNNERMFARQKIEREGLDKQVEAHVSKKLIDDAEKEVADAQAKLDAAKSAAVKAKKDAEDKEAALRADEKALEEDLNKPS